MYADFNLIQSKEFMIKQIAGSIYENELTQDIRNSQKFNTISVQQLQANGN